MQTIEITDRDSGQKLIRYLQKYMSQATPSFFHKMLRKKNITLNKKKADGTEVLKAGDCIYLFLSDETIEKFKSRDNNRQIAEAVDAYKKLQGVKILYEDEDMLALHKPWGVLSQKAKPDDISLNEWVLGYCIHSQDTLSKPAVCNRLDRNTTGIVLCGKSQRGLRIIGELIRNHKLNKYYYALVHGHLEGKKHLVAYLEKDESNNTVKIHTQKTENSSLIETEYEALRYDQTNDITLLKVHLITGKSHQIRAHLASIGHSVVGDFKYSLDFESKMDKIKFHAKTQLLHAGEIVFPDEEIEITAWKNLIIKDDLPNSFSIFKG